MDCKVCPAPTCGRAISPWLVINDWTKAGGARVSGTERYRDFARTCLPGKRRKVSSVSFSIPNLVFP